MSDHTPTTADIVNVYTRDTDDFHFARAEFYRWYAAEIAAAEQRGAVKALRDAAREYEFTNEISIKHDEVIDFLDTLADEYRADQEGDDVEDRL